MDFNNLPKNSKIGLIDCDLISHERHNFPNLALMKISGYLKSMGHNVELTNYDSANPNSLFYGEYNQIFAAKVFSDTKTPYFIKNTDKLKVGGSGFYYNHEHSLPEEIEHFIPDYDLYSKFRDTEFFTNYSIGFTTRGCFRKCPFCINQNYDKVFRHSKVSEFLDTSKPYIMLLDDNITGFSGFYDVFNELNATKKPFIFKQGMDFRILSLKKMKKIWDSNYYSGKKKSKGGRTFFYAFDDINDYNLIDKKLNLYYSNIPYRHNLIFYVFTGFDRDGKYDNDFFEKDIRECLQRIELLFNYGAFGYVMLHANYKLSPYSKLLNELKNICNAPIHVAGKYLGDALLQKGYTDLYEWIEQNEPQYLKLYQNVKNIKTI